MVYRTQFRSGFICNFCGNQNSLRGSCAGCGGSSFRREIIEVPTSKSDDGLRPSVTEVKNRQKRTTIGLSIIVACLLLYVVTKNPDKEHSGPQDRVANHQRNLSPATISNTLETLPKKGFRAYYYHTGSPNFIHHETVNSIDLKTNSGADIHGIEPHKLSVLWEGKLHRDKKGFIDVLTKKRNASVRLRIDGTTIPLASNGTKTTIELDQGEHLVEVDYKHGSRNIDFHLSFRNHSIEYSKTGITNKLSKLIPEDYRSLYVYQRQTPASARSTLVHLNNIAGPVVLVLDSHYAIDWQILNSFSVDLRAIVVGSYKGGSSVQGDQLPEIMTLRYDKNDNGLVSQALHCICSDGCRGSGLVGLTEELESVRAGTLSGITISHSTISLSVPETTITEEITAQTLIEHMQRQEDCPRPSTSSHKKQKKLATVARPRVVKAEVLE